MKTFGTRCHDRAAGVAASCREGAGPAGRLVRAVSRHLLSPLVAMATVLVLVPLVVPRTDTGSVGSAENLQLELIRRQKPTSTTAPTDTVPPTTVPSSTTVRRAGFETGDFSELDMNQANSGSIAITTSVASSGVRSSKSTVGGGLIAQYARVGYAGPWGPGEQVVYQGSFFFPGGFYTTLTNQMDLMRFDNWDDRPTASEQTGLTINLSGEVKNLYIFRNQLGIGGAGITYIAGPFQLPTENAWHDLEVRQTLSPFGGSASNALYVDGVLQGSTTNANMFGSPGNRYNWFRAGIVSSGTAQTAPISLYLDDLIITGP